MSLQKRLQNVSKEIIDAKHKFSRENEIKLLAVSKKRTAKEIRTLYELGQKSFGESYLQEAINKKAQLKDCDIEWHFIGPIQSNKTKLIAQNFDWVQSVSRLKIAERLNSAAINKKTPLNILIQINLNNEINKEGIKPSEFLDFCLMIKNFPNLKLKGIMAIPEKQLEARKQAINFLKLKDIYNLHREEFDLDTLSMGMSGDYSMAIKNGSTMIRIGTKLFESKN